MKCPECGAPLSGRLVQRQRKVWQYFGCLNGLCAKKYHLHGTLTEEPKVVINLPATPLHS